MPLPRTAAFRNVVRPRAAGASRSGFASRWRQASRRGYASEGEKATQNLTSEFPWIAGASAATVGGLFLVVNSGKFGPLLNHALPGQNYHGEGHDDEHEEGEEDGEKEDGEEGGEGGDEKEGGDGEDEKTGGDGEDEEKSADGEDEKKGGDGDDDSKSDGGDAEPAKGASDDQGAGKGDGGDEGADKDDSSKAPASGGRGSKQTGKRVTEQPEDGKLSRKVKGQEGDEPADWDQEHVYETEGSSTVIHKPDAKGGAKRRIESAYGTKHGLLESEEDGKDTAAASKTPVKGSMSGKQAGLSNTDTKHPYDLSKQSRRFEDAPDSAKLQGTVDPHMRD